MALTAQDVLNRVRVLLVDTDSTNYRWTDAEIFRWIGDAQRVIVGIKPNACNSITTLSLVAGTRQTLPADGFIFMGANCNIVGSARGRAVRVVQRDDMDRLRPNWHGEGQVATVQNVIFDPLDQTAFFVYPPNDGTGKIEINYAKHPTEVASGATPLVILDAYMPPVVDYVCYRCFIKDGPEGSKGVAQDYLTSFAQALGIYGAGEDSVSPNLQLGPTAFGGAKGAAR